MPSKSSRRHEPSNAPGQPRERPAMESSDAHDANQGVESPPPSSRADDADDADAADESTHDTPSPVDITPDERGEPDPRRDD